MIWRIEPINVIIIEWVFVAIATVFVGLRVFMRNRDLTTHRRPFKRLAFNLSDWVILATLICFYASASCDTVMVVHGFDDGKLNLKRNKNDANSAYNRLPGWKLKNLLMMLYFSTIPYYLSLWGVKCYLLVLYYKIIQAATMPRQRIALHVITAIVASTCVVWICINMFWCHPISRNWDVTSPEDGTCLAYFAEIPYITTVSLHVGTEILIFTLPFSFLHILRRHSKNKFYAAAGLFAFGFLGVIVTIGRTIYIFTAGYAAIINIVQAWAALEQCVGIIICCLPAFRSMFVRPWDKSDRESYSNPLQSGTQESTTQGSHSKRRGNQGGTGERGRLNVADLRGHWNRRSTVIDPEVGIMRVETFEKEVNTVNICPDQKQENLTQKVVISE